MDMCYAALCGPCNMFTCCSMHLIKEGNYGMAWWGADPVILESGRHFLTHPTLWFDREVSQQEQHIQHGPIHIVRVDKGKLGYAIDTTTGQPMLLVAGTHYVRQGEFKWGGFLDLTKPINSIGVIKLVRVERGQVGYFFKRGELEILEPGLHVIAPPDRFENFLSTQLQLLQLPRLVHESGDYVGLRIDADVLYSIVDPKRALLRVKDLTKLIEKTAVSTLANIIRSSHLNEVAGSSRQTYNVGKDGQLGERKDQPSAPSFSEKVHDQFLEELHEYMSSELGVNVSNIRINDLSIDDRKLSANIAREAVKIAEQDAEYHMLQKEADIKTVRANNAAVEVKIAAQAKADQKLILVKAETDASLARAGADAQAAEIAARAKKTAIILEAEAEAKAIALKAKAQSEAKKLMARADDNYAKQVGSTKLGSQLATLEVQKQTLTGVQKVAYVPGMPNLLAANGARLNIEMKADDI